MAWNLDPFANSDATDAYTGVWYYDTMLTIYDGHNFACSLRLGEFQGDGWWFFSVTGGELPYEFGDAVGELYGDEGCISEPAVNRLCAPGCRFRLKVTTF